MKRNPVSHNHNSNGTNTNNSHSSNHNPHYRSKIINGYHTHKYNGATNKKSASTLQQQRQQQKLRQRIQTKRQRQLLAALAAVLVLMYVAFSFRPTSPVVNENLAKVAEPTAAELAAAAAELEQIVQHNIQQNTKIAYAFFLGGIPSSNDHYIPSLHPASTTKARPDDYRGLLYNILVSVQTLRQAGSRAAFIVLVHMADPHGTAELPLEDARLLDALDIQVVYTPPTTTHNLVPELSTVTLEKFRVAEFTDYHRIMVLQPANVTPRGNLDYLMELSLAGKLHANILISTAESPVTSSVFVVTPRMGAFWNLLQLILERTATTPGRRPLIGWGLDHTTYWTTAVGNRGKDYTFPGADSDPGLLLEWTKYLRKNVSIVVGHELEHWANPSSRMLQQGNYTYPQLEHWTTGLTWQDQYTHRVVNLATTIPNADNQHLVSSLRPYACIANNNNNNANNANQNNNALSFYDRAAPYCDVAFWPTQAKPWNLPQPPSDSDNNHNNNHHDYQAWFKVLRQLNDQYQMNLGFNEENDGNNVAKNNDNANTTMVATWNYIPAMPPTVFYPVWSAGVKALRQWAFRLIDTSQGYIPWQPPVFYLEDATANANTNKANLQTHCHCPNNKVSTDVCSATGKSLEDWLSRRVPYYLSLQRPLCPRATKHSMHVLIPIQDDDNDTTSTKDAVCSAVCQDYPAAKISIVVYDNRGDGRGDALDLCDSHQVVEFEPLENVQDEEVGRKHVRDALEQSNTPNRRIGGEPLCIQSTKHLEAGGATYWAFRFMEQLTQPNGVVVVAQDGAFTTRNALEIINDKYMQGALTTYGSSATNTNSSLPIPDSFTKGANRFRPRKNKPAWRFGGPNTFKAHLLQQVTLEDFTTRKGTWLMKGANRGFVYRMLEKAGSDRVRFISEPIFEQTALSINNHVEAEEFAESQIQHLLSFDESTRLAIPLHLVMVCGTEMELLSDQLVWLQEQTFAKTRTMILHLLFNDPTLHDELKQVVDKFHKFQQLVVKGSSAKRIGVRLAKLPEHEPLNDFSRILFVDELRRKEPMESVVFLDSDQFFQSGYVELLMMSRRPKSMTSWSGRIYSGKTVGHVVDFTDTALPLAYLVSGEEPKKKSFVYSAHAGAVFDANLWLFDSQLLRPKYDLKHLVGAHDVWVSYVMDALLGWKKYRLVAKSPPFLSLSSLHKEPYNQLVANALPSISKDRLLMFNKMLAEKGQTTDDNSRETIKRQAFAEMQKTFHWQILRQSKKPMKVPSIDLVSVSHAGTSLSNITAHDEVARQTSEPDKTKRVFVCVTGQVSRLEVENKIETFFGPLQNAGFMVDIALVVSNGTALLTNVDTKKNDSVPFYTDFKDPLKALEKRNIKVLSRDDPYPTLQDPFVPEQYVRYLKLYGEGRTMDELEERAKSHARIFDSYRRCMDYADKATAEARSKGDRKTPYYDAFVRMREDVGFHKQINPKALVDSFPPPPNSIIVTECRSWNGVNDRLAIVAPDIARRYFQRPYELFFKGENILDPGVVRTPETLLLYIYTTADIHVLGHPLLVGVHRMFKRKNGERRFNKEDVKKEMCPQPDPYREQFGQLYGWTM